MKYSRRKFIKISGLAIGGTAFAVSCKMEYPGYYYFTREEGLCILAICEQIVPADKDPGATDAGVIHYIDKQLTGYFKSEQEFYRIGIAALQKSSIILNNMRFEEMSFSDQTNFLKRMEKGELPLDEWSKIRQVEFFNRLVEHTMQGYYGSPRHGGNKDYVSYTMMGLEYPLVIGQNRYKNLL